MCDGNRRGYVFYIFEADLLKVISMQSPCRHNCPGINQKEDDMQDKSDRGRYVLERDLFITAMYNE
jgi:hypothetical protein